MEQIEKATGKQIIRIETNDLDEMEEVRVSSRGRTSRSRDLYLSRLGNTFRAADVPCTEHAANEEGTEVDAAQWVLGSNPQTKMYSCFVSCSHSYPLCWSINTIYAATPSLMCVRARQCVLLLPRLFRTMRQ